MKYHLLISLLSFGLLGCSSEPKIALKDDPVIYRSCQPKPFEGEQGGDPPAALTSQVFPEYGFSIGVPNNWLIGKRNYPESSHQQHATFVLDAEGKHNPSGFGRIGIHVAAVSSHYFKSFDEFVEDGCDNIQTGDIPFQKLWGSGYSGYYVYLFCWEKYPKVYQYTETVFFKGSNYYYRVGFATEAEERFKYRQILIKMLDSFKTD